MEFYLRVEGVNLANFIFDTTDLNTMRGGGLLLLDAIKKIEKHFSQQLQAISTGGSSGLFSFTVTNFEKAKIIQKQVIEFINHDPKLKHATFVIDILPAGESFNEDKEKLLALNRWQQMQSPTLVVPEPSQQKFDNPVCNMDKIRPAARVINRGFRTEMVSESVFQRHKYGRQQRQTFHKRQTDLKKLPDFVNNFYELTDDRKRGNLNGKMAVIYLDGNGFGKIQQKICQGNDAKDALQLFDEQIKDYRLDFLRTFLVETIGQSEWTYFDPTDKHKPKKYRLEILLWGGDEILLVVPAWVGWWTLEYFFRKSKDWEFPALNGDEIYSLTHAAGLVFCHCNTPIHQAINLAGQLVTLAKNKSRKANYFAYQILDSFKSMDYDSLDLFQVYEQRYRSLDITLLDLIIPGNEEMSQTTINMDAIKRTLSKSQVADIVHSLLHAPEHAKILIGMAEMQLNTTLAVEFAQLRRCFGEGIIFWLHLFELWDYIDLWHLSRSNIKKEN